VKHTTERSWWRLVGRRHDVLLWQPDTARSPPPLPRHPAGNFKYNQAALPENLQWIAKTFEPVRRAHFNDVPFFEIFGPPQAAYGAPAGSQHHFALLVGHVPNRSLPPSKGGALGAAEVVKAALDSGGWLKQH